MRARITDELALLRRHFGDLEHAEARGEDWFRIPRFVLPDGWRIGKQPVSELPVCFLVKGNYPGDAPYGFLAPAGLNFNGAAPNSTGGPPSAPPFAGEWLHFSWSVENWAATADVGRGSNLLAWVRSFMVRFREGA
ncbi:MAG: hypothetical protein EOR30_33650 [Mesorhizobium sp.]|uniref:hypothetical protein n=1 Tax=Mesorhizobium sp. TaxID=1871066 RepID=UPI000FE7B779|nr:hypothetical protein [Mesorhizobium sp.]RWI62447.1 MAG: hypothetical protein EOR17_33200 [Mesorhizobium sp.]RWJ40847.1 MAG: hypothetical protein EOR30_33650 [Mesorhizobium sp.]RWJ58158.1 MAG: hypothetical protein EOR32_26615 [Mesorhizobium sp.]RWJ66646.1 MAG: hypothetical protein EOR34_27575 [Mesorhizobium sp.]RWJ93884.1 MAG: hypothetical protein EOR38_30280 [Mesorhizobium sp.]